MSDVKEHAEESNGLNNGSPATKRLKKDVDNGEASVEYDFDSNTQKILEEIDLCQNEIDSLNEKASEEILKVEQKFNKLRKPFFEKRNELIKTIPSFWVQAFINHHQIRSLISTEEEGCIQHLKNIEIEEFEDIKSGYRIKFHFDENPYFENKVLVKEFHLGHLVANQHVHQLKLIGNKHLKGKNLHDVITSKQRKSKVSITFFLWFLENGDASSDDVAEIIKDDLWPNPLQYFLNSEMDQNTADESDDNIVELEDEDDEENDNDLEGEEDDEEGDDEEVDE